MCITCCYLAAVGIDLDSEKTSDCSKANWKPQHQMTQSVCEDFAGLDTSQYTRQTERMISHVYIASSYTKQGMQ